MKNTFFFLFLVFIYSCSKSSDNTNQTIVSGELSYTANNIQYKFVDGVKDQVSFYRRSSTTGGPQNIWILRAERISSSLNKPDIQIDIESQSNLNVQTYSRFFPFLIGGNGWSAGASVDTSGTLFTQQFSGDFNNIIISKIDNNKYASGTFSVRFTDQRNINSKLQITNGTFSNVKIL